MRTSRAVRMMLGFLQATMQSIKELPNKLSQSEDNKPVFYDMQKKVVINPETRQPVYCFNFLMLSEKKDLRDKMADTLDAVTISKDSADKFFELGGKIREIKIEEDR